MCKSWLGTFIVPNFIIGDNPRKAEDIIEKTGFDILYQYVAGTDDYNSIRGLLDIDENGIETDAFTLFIVADLSPWGLNGAEMAECDNLRLMERGPVIESELLRAFPSVDRNPGIPVFSASKNMDLAEDIIKKLDHALFEKVKKRVTAMEQQMQVPAGLKPLNRFSGFNTNGEVYLVNYNGSKAVLRMFRPGREVYARNESSVLKLSSTIEGIPQLLDEGENWVLTSYFENSVPLSGLKNKFMFLPLKPVRRAFEICEEIYNHGFALLDFIPSNVLINHKEEVQLIDFEWLQKLDKPGSFDSGTVITGTETNTDFDIPNGPAKSYKADWEPLTGVSYSELKNWSLTYLETRNWMRGKFNRLRGKLGLLKQKVLD